jgi:hypothetical protein
MKYSLLFLSLLILPSCKKNNPDSYMEKKIRGTWTIEEVREHGFFENKNITSESEEQKFEFMDDHKLLYTNRNNQTFAGTWDLNQNYYNCGDNTQIEYLIGIHVSDPVTGTMKIYSGNNLSVSKKCMSFYHRENTTSFQYKLKRD